MTGRYYTTVEWVQRENNRKELAQAKQRPKESTHGESKKPRYRVLNHHATASAKKK